MLNSEYKEALCELYASGTKINLLGINSIAGLSILNAVKETTCPDLSKLMTGNKTSVLGSTFQKLYTDGLVKRTATGRAKGDAQYSYSISAAGKDMLRRLPGERPTSPGGPIKALDFFTEEASGLRFTAIAISCAAGEQSKLMKDLKISGLTKLKTRLNPPIKKGLVFSETTEEGTMINLTKLGEKYIQAFKLL